MRNSLAILFLLLAWQSQAATLCVKPSSSGSADGSDWNNALGSSFTPVRGNTYYLADGSYGAKSFSTAASGTTMIYIKKATVADHGTSTGWSDTLGDGIADFSGMTFSTSYWYIDGQVGGGPTSWAAGYGFVVYNTSTPVIVLSGTVGNITLRHTAIGSDRGATTDPGGTTGSGFGGGIKGTTGSCTDITVSYCAITNIYGPLFHISAWTNSTVEYCYLARNRSTADWHSEGVSSISANNNCVWRWNLWDQIEGTAIFAGVNSGSSDNWKIYGNIFSRSSTPIYYYWESGSNKNSMNNAVIYNNTIVGCGPNSQGGFVINQGAGNVAYNNLFYKNDANAYGIDAAHDYTFVSDNIRSADGPFDKDADIIIGEAHGQNSSGAPFVSYNVEPLLANYAAQTAAGTSLSAPYNVDMFGNTRGADGTWDRGAVEYSSGPDVTPPTVQGATINAAGTVLTLNYSEAVTGGTGFTLTPSGGASSLSGHAGDSTSTHTYNLSRTILQGETLTLAYSPGNVVDLSTNAMTSFSGMTVVNDSVYNTDPPLIAPNNASYVTNLASGYTITASGLPSNYGFGGSLPAGVSFTPPNTSGTLSFTPTGTLGDYTVTLSATNAFGWTQTNVTWTLVAAPTNSPVGNTNDAATTDTVGADVIDAYHAYATNTITATTIYAKIVGQAGHYKTAIYADNLGVPGTLLGSSYELSTMTSGWTNFPLTAAVTLTAGNWYWLAVWSDNASAAMYYTADVGTMRYGPYTYGSWPSPASLNSTFVASYCIYATGTTFNPSDTTPPSIAITSPANGAVTALSTTPISGTSSDDVFVDTIMVTNTTAATASVISGAANWSTSIGLNLGANTIKAIAIDLSGNRATNTITINRVYSLMNAQNYYQR